MQVPCQYEYFDFLTTLTSDRDYVATTLNAVNEFAQFNGIDSVVATPAERYELDDFEAARKSIEETPYNGLRVMTATSQTLVPVRVGDQGRTLSDVIVCGGLYVLIGGLGGLGQSAKKTGGSRR